MYHNFIFLPLYNGLVGIMYLIPWLDVGMAVIIFTIIVKLVLFPLSKTSLLTQIRMKEVEPEMNKIKADYASDRQAQATKTMELYKAKGIKPFAGILLLIIQLPILLALISVFYKITPEIHPEFLYSFIGVPHAALSLLGLSLVGKSFILSLITGVIQFLQLHFSPATRAAKKQAVTNPQKGFGGQLSSSMNTQMKFMLPVLAFASTYWLIPASFPQAAAIIAVYWSVSSLFTLGQELYINKRYVASKNKQ